jgi:GNAT superfamily N-acetyltransferase
VHVDLSSLERNEADWWSRWAEVKWFGGSAYALSSKRFDEPFFNRACLIGCSFSKTMFDSIESYMAERGLQLLTVNSQCRMLRAAALKRGYSPIDEMSVFVSAGPFSSRSGSVRVLEIRNSCLVDWAKVYLLSFYGDLSLLHAVAGVIRRLGRDRKVTLLIAEVDGTEAGVTALYRTERLMGVYCVGTLKEFRRKGVGSALLAKARELAEKEGRTVFLQTLLSDRAEKFYESNGFRKLYTKLIFSKPASKQSGVPVSTSRSPLLRISINRNARDGIHPFPEVFKGFERVEAVKRIFGERTHDVLSSLEVEVVDGMGYLHVDDEKKRIVVNSSYLREGQEEYIYLDVIHELVHIRQLHEGKELFDRRYRYVDRPTELEAYRLTLEEARRIGLDNNRIIDYLRVEWVSDSDFKRFLVNLGVSLPPSTKKRPED